MRAGPSERLATAIPGLALRTPLVAAAGTCGVLDELAEVSDLRWLGAVTTKSLTPEPREGNAPWRVVETKGGMLNAIGLANPGIDAFVRDHAPRARAMACGVIGSAAGHGVDAFVGVACALESAGLRAIELNVSCPNTADGRMFGSDPVLLGSVISAVRAALRSATLLVKLPPDGDPVSLSRVAVEAGAQVLTLCNTFPAMQIDPESRMPALSRGSGGLSGPGIHPIVVRIVREVHRQVAGPAGVPIIGLGGVLDWRDAAELVLAGASAVGVGTALLVDPGSPRRIAQGLDAWCARQGVGSIAELVGAVSA
jgi:dihydroorotate dehydrogenase (NAD+) catalytic subunit